MKKELGSMWCSKCGALLQLIDGKRQCKCERFQAKKEDLINLSYKEKEKKKIEPVPVSELEEKSETPVEQGEFSTRIKKGEFYLRFGGEVVRARHELKFEGYFLGRCEKDKIISYLSSTALIAYESKGMYKVKARRVDNSISCDKYCEYCGKNCIFELLEEEKERYNMFKKKKKESQNI